MGEIHEVVCDGCGAKETMKHVSSTLGYCLPGNWSRFDQYTFCESCFKNIRKVVGEMVVKKMEDKK